MPRTLFLLFGKRKGRRRLLISSHVGGKLIFLHNAVSGRRFLVDTGAARSVLPHRFSATADGPRLVGADGRPIPTWKTISINLQFGVQKFTFPFLLAAVQHHILGKDFLRKFKLLVDSFNYNVVASHTGLSVTSATSAPVFLWVSKLLNSFPNTVRIPTTTTQPLHRVEHTIETSGRPVFAKARRLDPEKLHIAKTEFRELVKAGFIRRSNSPWASPLHMVPKKDGSWRP